MSIMIYLDNASTSIKKPIGVYRELFKNTLFSSFNAGRGTYKKSIGGVLGVMDTRESIAELFNIKNPMQIAFTQNATYALNLLIFGFLKPEDHVIITGVEHNSVLRPVHRHKNYTVVKADKKGNVKASDVEEAILDNTKLIICTHASNVSGSIEPISEIGKTAKKHGIKFLVDSAQTAGIIDIDVEKMNIDMLAFSGHKGLMGPLGTGGLYVAEEIRLKPLVVGGTGSLSESFTQPGIMPDMLQSGTQNTPAIISLKEGVDFVKKHRGEIFDKEKALATEFIEGLLNIKGVKVYGNIKTNRNGTVAFNIGNKDCVEVATRLEEDYKILLRSGFHCSPLAHRSLGTEKTGCIRASFGFFNTEKDVKKIIFAINKISSIGKQ